MSMEGPIPIKNDTSSQEEVPGNVSLAGPRAKLEAEVAQLEAEVAKLDSEYFRSSDGNRKQEIENLIKEMKPRIQAMKSDIVKIRIVSKALGMSSINPDAFFKYRQNLKFKKQEILEQITSLRNELLEMNASTHLISSEDEGKKFSARHEEIEKLLPQLENVEFNNAGIQLDAADIIYEKYMPKISVIGSIETI